MLREHNTYSLKTILFGLVLGLIIGASGGWLVFASDRQTSQTPALQPGKPEQAATDENLETMTLAQMTDLLDNAPDDDFERQYLNVAIHLGNYTTAVNRIGKERAEREELKKFAESYESASRGLTRQLFDWQKGWGHTDH